MCHWRYVIDHIVGKVQSVDCLGITHIPKRWDENNKPYNADADDVLYANLMLENGVIAQVNSSWCTRVNRDDLVTFQIDGTNGSAVARLTQCKVQSLANTPRPVWNPDAPNTINFQDQWEPSIWQILNSIMALKNSGKCLSRVYMAKAITFIL